MKSDIRRLANVSIVELADGREVCLSYGVIVAAFIPGRGYLKTATRYSRTTSKHVNMYCAYTPTEVPDAELRELCQPLSSR